MHVHVFNLLFFQQCAIVLYHRHVLNTDRPKRLHNCAANDAAVTDVSYDSLLHKPLSGGRIPLPTIHPAQRLRRPDSRAKCADLTPERIFGTLLVVIDPQYQCDDGLRRPDAGICRAMKEAGAACTTAISLQ